MAASSRVILGQDEVDGVDVEVPAVHARRPRVRLVLPFVGKDEIDVPERERGQRLLGLGFDELAAQVGRRSGERLHRRHREMERDRLKGGDSPPPGDPARGGGQLGLRELGPLEQRKARIRRMPVVGALLCLASAAAFGAMGIFGKLAYTEGATVGTLLTTRFVLAAALLWLFVACAGHAHEMRALARRDVGAALALGAVGYGGQAGGYFAALERLDAALLSLLVYTFPVIVTVTAIALGREPASRRTALALTSIGLVLVLASAAAGALDPASTILGLATAVVYSAYVVTSEGVAERLGPVVLSTLVCTGAAITLTLGRAQLAGGALVLLAVLAVRTPARPAVTRPPIHVRQRPRWDTLVLPLCREPDKEAA